MATANTAGSEMQTLIGEVRNLAKKVEENNAKPASRATGTGFIRGGDGPNAPHVMKGVFGEDSRPFSISRFFANVVRGQNQERGKLEREVSERFKKGLKASGFNNCPHLDLGSSSLLLPVFGFDHWGEDANANEDIRYCKAVMTYTREQAYDPEEMAYLVRKYPEYKKAQSAFAEGFGGSIVQPPLQGAAIPIVRPKAAFLAAGAQTVTLPPQGRMVRPRLLQPTVAQALGEQGTTPDSTVTTGQLVLTAKKFAASTIITEEANTFTSGTMDTLVRADLDRTLGLYVDAAAFYGNGGNLVPAGLLSPEYADTTGTGSGIINVGVNFPLAGGVISPVPRGIGANGNTLLPQYGDLFPAMIGERSFDIEASTGAWIMRPGALAAARSFRADAISAGDEAGVFVDILRKFAERGPEVWTGRKVIQTTNIMGTLTKGGGANLSDVFYGIWEHAIMAAYGAIQFTQGTSGTDFMQGQYRIRGVLYGDIGFEYPPAFLVYRNVLGLTQNL